MLVLAGAAYFFLFSGGEAEAAAPEHGGYVALEPVAVNLAGGGYLKIGITLDITTAAAAGGGHGGGAASTAPRPTTRSSRRSPRPTRPTSSGRARR